MTTITVTYQMPDDIDEFNRVHHVSEAWSAIDEALNKIRAYYKHEACTAEDTIRVIQGILAEAQGRIE